MSAMKSVVCPVCGEHNDPKYDTCWNCDRLIAELRDDLMHAVDDDGR